MRKSNWCLLLLFTIVSLAPRVSIAKEKLAVMDLKAKYGVEKGLAEGLSVVIRDHIHGFGDYEVLSKDDVEAIAERTVLRQKLGCDETQCLIDIGRSLGTKFMVAGDLSKFGDTYNLSLRLIDTMGKDPGVRKRANRSCECKEDELINSAATVASLLMGKEVSAQTIYTAKKQAPPGAAVLYDRAFLLFRSGQLEAAQAEFSRYLERYPTTTLADNAQFWLGECYYSGKQYREAIAAYQKTIIEYPMSEKISSALLKQGMAYLELGDKTAGKIILKKVVKDYPNSNQAKIAKNKLTRLR